MAEEVEILTPDQTVRAISQLVAAAGQTGIRRSELDAAIGELESLAISAALWHTWDTGQTRISWSEADHELRYWPEASEVKS